jgi:chromosome segregation ATPase
MECARLVAGELVLPKQQRVRDLSTLHSSLASTRASFLKMQVNLGNGINHLKGQLKALRSKGDADDGQILALEGQLAGLMREYASLESKTASFGDWASNARRQLEHLEPEARAESLAQRKQCSARNGSKP